MQNHKLPILLSLVFIAISCSSPTEEINKAFHNVDKSLQKANEYLDDPLEKLYDSIIVQKNKNINLVNNADNIYKETKNTFQFIDSLKEVLKLQDGVGDNLNIASKLLVKTLTGKKLKDKLVTIYNYSYSTLETTQEKLSLDSVAYFIAHLNSGNNWSEKYFDMTPTVAAITMLTKFENDSKNLAIIGLTSVKRQIGK